jgi:hypothetical protein
LVIEQRTPGSLSWDLYLFSAPGAEVFGVNVATTGFTDFAFNTALNLSLPDCFFFSDTSNGIQIVTAIAQIPEVLGGSDDLDGLLLGTYTSALPTLESVGLWEDAGGYLPYVWASETSDPYPPDEVVAVIVPEARLEWLGLLAFAALALLRRSRPAQHLAG